jgi:hypothetical protein
MAIPGQPCGADHHQSSTPTPLSPISSERAAGPGLAQRTEDLALEIGKEHDYMRNLSSPKSEEPHRAHLLTTK